MPTLIKIKNILHDTIKFNVCFENLKIIKQYGVKQPYWMLSQRAKSYLKSSIVRFEIPLINLPM